MHELFIPIKLAIKNLKSNIGRTLLSLVGIVIGVTSVILVLSFGEGVRSFIVNQVSVFGTDLIQIEIKVPKTDKTSSQNMAGQAGGMQITTFKLEDAEKVGKLKNVESWYAMIMSQQMVSYRNTDKQIIIMGVTSEVAKADQQMKFQEGAMYTNDDDLGLAQVAVLGSEAAKNFFGEREAVGEYIKIKGQSYKVVGFLKERGMAGFFNFDETIYVPLQTLQKKIMGVDHIQAAVFNLHDMKQLDATILDATDIMRDRHDITDPNDDDFAVNSIVEIMNILDNVFFAINALLLALVSISLVVGGVGIMNVMYVSVVERTYEIGLKKSLGAKDSQILTQFLSEAIFLTLLGGVIGVGMGIAISQGVVVAAKSFGYNIEFPISLSSIAIGFGFSAVTGIIFGFWPAKKASQLSPMEALRKE